MPPIRDVEHHYTDWKGAQGHCRVRVYPATAAPGGLPVVIVSELASNHGPSVANTVEQLGAEIASRYLPEQDGLEPPFVLVEHYPDRQVHQPARWHDPGLGETFDLVTFGSYTGRPRWHGPHRGMLQRFGEPDWRRIPRGEVDRPGARRAGLHVPSYPAAAERPH